MFWLIFIMVSWVIMDARNSLLSFVNSSVLLHLCQVVEHGLGHLPFTEKQVITPTGEQMLPMYNSSS